MSIALVVSDFSTGDEQNGAMGCCELSKNELQDVSTSSILFNRRRSGRELRSAGTLIICPMSLMSQWLEEFRSKVPSCRGGGSLHVAMYYGADRDKDNDIFGIAGDVAADIVITSYGVLTSEWRRGTVAGSPGSAYTKNSVASSAAGRGRKTLLSKHWRRVILDEGHTIRNPATDSAQACHLINAERRWVLSGTPVSLCVSSASCLE